MARIRNVGFGNLEKMSRGVASILGLSEDDRLLLKAEIIGYLGNGQPAAPEWNLAR